MPELHQTGPAPRPPSEPLWERRCGARMGVEADQPGLVGTGAQGERSAAYDTACRGRRPTVDVARVERVGLEHEPDQRLVAALTEVLEDLAR